MDRSYSMTINNELLDFIHASPTAFHAVNAVQEILEKQDYEKLTEMLLRILEYRKQLNDLLIKTAVGG